MIKESKTLFGLPVVEVNNVQKSINAFVVGDIMDVKVVGYGYYGKARVKAISPNSITFEMLI